MGQLIMIGTMAILLVLILGLVYVFDPEARGSAPPPSETPSEASNEEPAA